MGVDLAAEEQFGPYLVYERLGVGGMATVHRALERGIEGFERIVALKRLLPHLAEDASFIKSFVREAKLASLLNHVNIVQIFELGRVGTEYFISMEYIDGRDIRRILRHARKVTGPPPIHVTVGLLLQLCEALDYAHSKVDEDGLPLKLVHRDISPSNLLVTLAGHLKIIDFGIAKAQSSQLRTQTGRVKGKLAYMAPEAISGRELDSRSDLFAAGVIAHELLTARPLFASKNEYQTLLKVQRGDIMPPSTFNQACPPELDAIVLKALARDPDDRFSEAGELRDLLLEMRKQYNLQTGHRDLSQWLDWAFSLEPPTGSFASQNTFDQTGSNGFDVAAAARQLKPRPRSERKEEEEAVEIAWGGGEAEGNAAPIVLDDVPDVSDKHLGAAPRIDIADDLNDDIPASQPSHGVRRPVRDTSPEPVVSDPSLALADEPTDASKRPAPRSTPPPIPSVRISASQPVARASAVINTPSLPPPIPNPALTIPAGLQPPRRTTAQGSGVTAPRSDTVPEHVSTPVESVAARSLSELSGLAGPAEGAEEPQDTQRTLPAMGVGTGPTVGLNEPSRPLEAGSLPRPKLPSTKPGHQAPARVSEPTLSELAGDRLIAEPVRAKRPSNVTIGSAIAARQSVRKTWVIIAGIVAAGGAATAITLYATRGQDTVSSIAEPVPRPPSKGLATLKFAIEPANAEITIEDKTHAGSPWSIEIEPGVHQIQIHADGYKARLTSLELSPAETYNVILSLDRLDTQAVTDANLILSSQPYGLEVVLDGQLLSQHTPLKMPLKPGPHIIILRQSGNDVWRHELVAEASVDYEFNPSMAAEKQRERASRIAPERREIPPAQERTVEPQKPPEPSKADGSASAPTPVTPPVAVTPPPVIPVTPTPTAPPPVTPVAPPPVAVPTPQPAIVQQGPITIAPTAVTRVSGDTPTLGKSKNAEIPAVIAAKVCIDTGGNVTSVQMISKLERHTASDLASTMRGWRYSPYKQAGVALSACFVVSFRAK